MRIGFTTSVIQRGKTGIAQYLFALLRELSRYSGQHTFILFVLEEDIPRFKPFANNMEIVAVDEKYRPPVRDILWHHTILPSLARSLKLDVLHVPSYRRMITAKPCKLVATIHDLAPFHLRGKYDWKRNLYARLVARWGALRQDRIICVSRKTAADVERFFGVPRRRLQVIYNGVDWHRFNSGDRTEAKNWSAEHFGLRRPFFLYVARIEHPGKNHVRLIQAYEQFRRSSGLNIQMVFAGSDWHGAEMVRRAARKSLYPQDIRLLGFVPDADLPTLYRAAEAFVYPSLFEGFGMPPVEAMACGCPVICSDRGSLGEVVGDAAAIIDPENIRGMTQALERVTSDADYREQLVLRGLARAVQFDWVEAARATMEVYRHVVEGPSFDPKAQRSYVTARDGRAPASST